MKNIVIYSIYFIFLLTIFCCQDQYQKLIDNNSIIIVDKKLVNDNAKNEINVTLFIKNNSQTNIDGSITFEITLNKSNKNKLRDIKGIKDTIERQYEKLTEEYSELVLNEITEKINKMRFKYDSLQSIAEVSDSTTILTFNVIQEISINPGGLKKLYFIKEIPEKYIGISEVSYIESIKILQLSKKN